ncbi:MAG: GH1 family beta-glucosidase [Trueperaceae bacterium]|nr:GH1 family beta-glucosidase [Trueperaceae bacterium]
MVEFPSEFVWGVSTSAYQIEGAATAGGKRPSIWDAFVRRRGAVADGATGDVAIDHLARLDEDVALIAGLGVRAYRFSIAWSRWFPDGDRRVAPAGRDVYDRLVDRLLEHGVAPWPCLYHWDLPAALQQRGGWTARDTVDRFADYAAAVLDVLGDRVGHVALRNEPNVHAVLGHLLGVHAPGTVDVGAFAAAAHHQHLATARVLARLRGDGVRARLGTVLNLQPVDPASDAPEDAAAARLLDAAWNAQALAPWSGGRYPEDLAALFAPVVRDGDEQELRAPLDWIGLNLYTRHRVAADPKSLIGLRLVGAGPDVATTAMGWAVAPDALREQLHRLARSLPGVPIYVTENGAAFEEAPGLDGVVDDRPRVRYLRDHVASVARARAEGVDVRGYFVWTLWDDFEWADGYGPTFGLVHVDRRDLTRTPERSFDWYRRLVATGRLPTDEGGPEDTAGA